MQRLYDKINKTKNCWVWTGAKNSYGYGLFVVDGKQRQAHRVVYELERGLIPPKLVCDHLCRNTLCVNPSHIELVTNGTNVLRGISNSAINARKTHCKAGHEYSKENTYITNKGWRRCKTCCARWEKQNRK